MPATGTAIIIRPGSVESTVFELNDSLAFLQGAVGGYIEAIDLGPTIAGYVNEEGKLQQPMLERNELATSIAKLNSAIMPEDWIAGPLVLVGFDEETGATVGLDPAVVTQIMAIAGMGD